MSAIDMKFTYEYRRFPLTLAFSKESVRPMGHGKVSVVKRLAGIHDENVSFSYLFRSRISSTKDSAIV